SMMQHALVERAVAFHRVRAQAVRLHHVVDAVPRALDAIVQLAEIPVGGLVLDHADPGHPSFRSLERSFHSMRTALIWHPSGPPCQGSAERLVDRRIRR